MQKVSELPRDLVNKPSEVLTPSEFANRTVSLGNEYGFEVEVFDKKSCEELDMSAFLTVAKGGAYEPKLIVMRYHGNLFDNEVAMKSKASSDSNGTNIISKGIIELRTLTGSCANFFSNVCCGVLTTDDTLFNKLVTNSDISGEKYWRIPHFDEYRKFIKSDVADLHNTSTAGAGGICAGLFLDEFSEDSPFFHV